MAGARLPRGRRTTRLDAAATTAIVVAITTSPPPSDRHIRAASWVGRHVQARAVDPPPAGARRRVPTRKDSHRRLIGRWPRPPERVRFRPFLQRDRDAVDCRILDDRCPRPGVQCVCARAEERAARFACPAQHAARVPRSPRVAADGPAYRLGEEEKGRQEGWRRVGGAGRGEQQGAFAERS